MASNAQPVNVWAVSRTGRRTQSPLLQLDCRLLVVSTLLVAGIENWAVQMWFFYGLALNVGGYRALKL